MPDNHHNHTQRINGAENASVPQDAYVLKPGDVIGCCRIEKLLGHGGMGEVYLAWHENLQAWRAIKTILPQNATSAQFLAEGRLQARLNQLPNIVEVYDMAYDEEHDICFMVMEYVDGGSVGSHLRDGIQYDEETALNIMRDVVETLGNAMVDGVQAVHRDIKPDNIMLMKNGDVKVGDWGIAALEGTHVENLGTPAYMAPELTVKKTPPSSLADIYALGVTFYEMLAGEKPFMGTMDEIIEQARTAERPDIRGNRPDVSEQTALLIKSMMAISRKDRPASWKELKHQLQNALDGLHAQHDSIITRFFHALQQMPRNLPHGFGGTSRHSRKRLAWKKLVYGSLAALVIGTFASALLLVNENTEQLKGVRLMVKKNC